MRVQNISLKIKKKSLNEKQISPCKFMFDSVVILSRKGPCMLRNYNNKTEFKTLRFQSSFDNLHICDNSMSH